MKKLTAVLALVLTVALLLCACAPAAEQQGTDGQQSGEEGALAIENGTDLVINECITLSAAGAEGEVTYSVTSGEDLVLLEGANLYALASGEVTVAAACNGQTAEKTFTISPYDRVAGGVAETEFGGPVGVWVDFNGTTSEIVYIGITGMGNPAVMEAYGDDFAALEEQKTEFYGQTAEEAAQNTEGVLAQAVASAAESYLSEGRFIIRPYQSMMVDRYLENNMHFEGQSENKEVVTTVVGAYPAGCAEVVTDDVLNGEDMKWPGGVSTAQVAADDETYTVTHNVVKANAAGVALIEYRCGDTVVYDAIDIYDNFTLYPEALSGSDSYGHVVAGPADLSADTLTYRVLGDKAMNFPGGTCGSTVIDVTIDRESRTLVDVRIAEHSDSTYLANAWEYNGNYAATGNTLYDIATFLAQFKGKSADTAIVKYVLTSQDAEGGVPVEGGIDMTVTGATRTPNAVIAAVNAAIEQFKADVPKA